MTLPKIEHPTFTTVLPSGAKATYRPFTGREQKVLLFAKESGDTSDVIRGLIDVIGACCPGLNPADLTIFDLEFLFLMIRAKSVGSRVEIKVTDDGKQYDAVVEIDKAMVEAPKATKSPKIEVAPGVIVVLKFPTARDVSNMPKSADEWDYLAASVSSVTSGEDVTSAADVSRDELKEWLKTLPLSAVAPMRDFFESKPKIYLEATYTVGDEVRKKRVSGVGDFFE